MTMKNKGLHQHRLKQNPEEMRFAEAWEKFCRGGHLEYLLSPDNSRLIPTKRDVVVAATVIQWLGSSVGEFWLGELGYERKK
jgi:hypothetical protein